MSVIALGAVLYGLFFVMCLALGLGLVTSALTVLAAIVGAAIGIGIAHFICEALRW